MILGCTGSAEIHFVSLHSSEIDPPPAKVWRFDAQEANWWIDDAGELNLAFRGSKRNLLLGALGNSELLISLVPGPPPAGSGRNYALRQRETRVILKSPLADQRIISYTGVMTVIVEDAQNVLGSFRIWMKAREGLNLLSLLPRSPGSVLCFGTFRAVRNERRGRDIRQQCEAGGWQRPPKTSAPNPTTLPS